MVISSHSRVGMGTASTVARPWVRGRRQDGWTSPSMLSSLRPPSIMLMSLCYTGLRSVVLVNQGSHVEKKEKTVFVKGVEGKTRARRVVDSTQILGTLG